MKLGETRVVITRTKAGTTGARESGGRWEERREWDMSQA